MLFLVRRELKIPQNMPPDRLEALKIQTMAYGMKLQREGKWLAGGWVVDKPIAYFMVNAQTAADLHALLASSPLGPYTKTEVTPLRSMEEIMAAATQSLDSLNTQERP